VFLHEADSHCTIEMLIRECFTFVCLVRFIRSAGAIFTTCFENERTIWLYFASLFTFKLYAPLGFVDGKNEGIFVGSEVGEWEGVNVGLLVGVKDGLDVGSCVGESDGSELGFMLGRDEGGILGSDEGLREGEILGVDVGFLGQGIGQSFPFPPRFGLSWKYC